MKRQILFIAMILMSLMAISQSVVNGLDQTVISVDTSQAQTGIIVDMPISNHPLDWGSVVYFFAILGMTLRTVFTTWKAIKNRSNGTPTTFDIAYFFRDNILPKLGAVMAMIMTIGNFFHLEPTESITAKILYCVIALAVGIVYDWLSEILKKINPNYKK